MGVSGCHCFATALLELLKHVFHGVVQIPQTFTVFSLLHPKMASIDLAAVGQNSLKSETGEVRTAMGLWRCSVCPLNGV